MNPTFLQALPAHRPSIAPVAAQPGDTPTAARHRASQPQRRQHSGPIAGTLLSLVIGLAGCGGSSGDTPPPPASTTFSVTSSSFVNGVMTQAQFASAEAGFGCTGGNRSPQLSWRHVPAGTKSLVVTMHDRDAPTGSGFWHWVLADIPANLSELAEGTPPPATAWQVQNDASQPGYVGACPPPGQIHRYDVTLHALDVDHLAGLLPADASPALVGFMVASHSLGNASLTAQAGTGTLGSGTPEPTPADFTLTSSDVVDGHFANAQFAPAAAGFGCDGGNLSPQLSWRGAPAGAKSYAVTMRDLDAPTGSGFWHWSLIDIPAAVQDLSTNAGAAPPTGALSVRSDAGPVGYLGLCPPPGQAHRYQLTVHALSVDSLAASLPPNPSPALVGFFVNGASLGKTSLTVQGLR